jgi:DNA-binding transcriptional regulator YdaS (Cro superfamily)
MLEKGDSQMKKQDVLSHFGGVKATANALGITSQAVSQWGEIVPKDSQKTIFIVTNGALAMSKGVIPEQKHQAA